MWDGSPFARLLERDGRILLLGVDIESMTFFHCIEEVLSAPCPLPPFTAEEFSLQSRDEHGVIPVSRRASSIHPSRRRDVSASSSRWFDRGGTWAETRLGELTLSSPKPKADGGEQESRCPRSLPPWSLMDGYQTSRVEHSVSLDAGDVTATMRSGRVSSAGTRRRERPSHPTASGRPSSGTPPRAPARGLLLPFPFFCSHLLIAHGFFE